MRPDEAAAGLRQCGLREIEAAFDDDLQEEVLVVADGQASEAQLECAAQVSLDSGLWVELPEPLREGYLAHYDRLSKARSRADARALLAAQGKLDTVPEYIPGTTDDAAFARQLEAFCSKEADGAFGSDFGPHALSPDRVRRTPDDIQRQGDTIICLITYAAAAGFDLGFIGNEAAPAR